MIKTSVDTQELQPAGKMRKVIVKNSQTGKTETLTAEQILFATGRVPNTFGLNLQTANVKLGERGNIDINNRLETSNPNIYAIGDVTGRAPFAHSAKRESHIALANALDYKKEEMNFDLVPWAIFTNPPIAAIGMSEEKAKSGGIDYGMLKASYARAGRATVIGQTDGIVKVIYNKKDKKILGAIIIGPRADDIIHEFVALINCNATTDTLQMNVIHIHPTLSEVFEALKDVPIGEN
jgi:pyruvate/2-oxoglutarate dehydrogenase complex dihydrolipoamide dehydrogenase (E3) component